MHKVSMYMHKHFKKDFLLGLHLIPASDEWLQLLKPECLFSQVANDDSSPLHPKFIFHMLPVP